MYATSLITPLDAYKSSLVCSNWTPPQIMCTEDHIQVCRYNMDRINN